MKQIIYFDISAFILLIGIIIIFYLKKNTTCIRNKLFKVIIWNLLLSTSINIFISVLYNEGIYLVPLSIIFRMLYYYSHTSIPIFFFAYLVVFIDDYKNLGKIKILCFLLPITLLHIVTTTTPFTHWLFYYNEVGGYVKGSFFYLSYIVAVYYLLIMIIFLFLNRKKYNKLTRTILYAFLFFTLFPAAIQLNIQGILIENFAATICALILYMTVESMDVLIDSNTKMYTQAAMIETVSTYYNSSTEFEAIVIKTAELELIIDRLGLSLVNELFQKVAEYLILVTEPAKSHYISNECFVILFNGGKYNIETIISEIQGRMKETWYVGDLEIRITEYICRISVPKDANNRELFFDYIHYIQNVKKAESNRIFVDEINLDGRKRRLQIEHAIKYALENDTFQVYYQPIFSFQDNKITSAEALVRLIDPVLGYIGPDEFIGISESNGTIIKLGQTVFEKVCEFISNNDLQALDIEYIEVNLSVIQCMQVDLVSDFKEILTKYKVDPKHICLEITETATENVPEILEKNIEEFKKIGIQLALDDYGTGYSNLYKMINLPFSFIKYDKNMIWAALSNEKAKIAVDGSMHLIKKLNMKVIAEGIETLEQLEELRKMECDYIQGYYFSRAIPEKEFIQFLISYKDKIA